MKYLFVFSFLLLSACGTTYVATGNQSQYEYNLALNTCEHEAQNYLTNRKAKNAEIKRNEPKRQPPPPSYKTDVMCYDSGYSVQCHGTTTADNSAAQTEALVENSVEVLSDIADEYWTSTVFDECMQRYGFVAE